MPVRKSLEQVEAAFVAAAIDPNLWNQAMEIAADATGSAGALMFPTKGPAVSIPLTRSMLGAYETYLRDGWYQRDERYRAIPLMMRNGVATDFDIFTAEDMQRHEYYQDFLARAGLQSGAIVKVASDHDVWVLSLQRGIGQGRFNPEELRLIASLSAKLSSAAALAEALSFAKVESALGAFESSGKAVVLLDRMGQVQRTNASADRLLDGDVTIANKRLASWSAQATSALDQALRTLLWSPGPVSLTPPVPLPRKDPARRPLLAYPSRMTPTSGDLIAACRAIVVLVDLDHRPRPPEETLRAIFGLTRAEARLARQLSSGESLADAADVLGIKLETARAHLKAVFSKTDTHRQSELVGLLAQLSSFNPCR